MRFIEILMSDFDTDNKSTTHAYIYPHGVGATVHTQANKPQKISNLDTRKSHGNEPYKDAKYMRTAKNNVDSIKKGIKTHSSITPVLALKHPNNNKHNVVIDGNHRLFTHKMLKQTAISGHVIPHSNVHLVPHNTDEAEYANKSIPLHKFKDKNGKYDMDKTHKSLNGLALKHYFVNSDGSHTFKPL